MESMPEAHEIKTFEDVVKMYQTRDRVIKEGPKSNVPPIANVDENEKATEADVAFYNFQRKHPGYNHLTME